MSYVEKMLLTCWFTDERIRRDPLIHTPIPAVRAWIHQTIGSRCDFDNTAAFATGEQRCGDRPLSRLNIWRAAQIWARLDAAELRASV